QGKSMGRLVAFHTREKLLLLSHSPEHYRSMGKLVAAGKQQSMGQLYDGYERMFVEALALKATPAKHVNVLQHILGYFKKNLVADEKQEMLALIDDYRAGHVPLIVPITLINHYVRKYAEPYLAQQSYLTPHPIALQLRNHV
ncbi:MAG: YbgA family protein, partial [Desulfatitalea sp.]|nr:YbgA family protein [Desulfatitalea sp.]